MPQKQFAYIRQYTIRPAHKSDFLAAYNPAGAWAELFSLDPSYIETKLLQDTTDENRYVTIDFWKSKESRDSFRARHSTEFDSLDARCEAFTEDEQFMGDYFEISDENRSSRAPNN